MGCDIHMHVEAFTAAEGASSRYWWPVKLTTNIAGEDIAVDWWHHRTYQDFARLAGVRNRPEWDIKPLDEPRGLPDDVSEFVRHDHDVEWEGDAHSTSWFTLAELQAVEWPENSDIPFLIHLMDDISWWLIKANGVGRLGGYIKDEEIRAVFWFDN